jgi:hypothetical protein
VESWVYLPAHERPSAAQGRLMSRPTADFRTLNAIRNEASSDVLLKTLGYYGNLNLLDGAAKLDGMFSLHERDMFALSLQIRAATNITETPLLDFLGVTRVPNPERLFSFLDRKGAMPLVTAGQAPVCLEPEQALMKLLSDKDFDPRREIILPSEARGTVRTTNAVVCEVRVITRTSHHLEFDVITAEIAMASIAQGHYPAWRARVNGQPARIWKANYAFQALEVPAGRSRVVVEYVDRKFLFGLACSLISLLMVGWLWWRTREPR